MYGRERGSTPRFQNFCPIDILVASMPLAKRPENMRLEELNHAPICEIKKKLSQLYVLSTFKVSPETYGGGHHQQVFIPVEPSKQMVVPN